MSARRILSFSVLLTAALAWWAPLSVAQPPTPSGTPMPMATPRPTMPVPFTVTLSTDRVAYAAGEPVTLTTVVRNRSGGPATFFGSSTCPITIRISAAANPTLMLSRPAFDPACAEDVRAYTLAAGEARTFVTRWNQRTGGSTVSVGEQIYAARASISLGSSPPEASSWSVPFVIGRVAEVPAPAATLPPPNAAILASGAEVSFVTPRPTAAPGQPPPRGGTFVSVVSRSDQPATVVYGGGIVVIAAPEGYAVQVTQILSGGDCLAQDTRPHVVQCRVSGISVPDRVTFTTVTVGGGAEAALDLADPRPCILPPASGACNADRAALWNGEPAAWAARGVMDPDARFNETVVFRVQAGDAAAIGAIARLLGQPYIKITRLRFLDGVPEREYVEVTNLGGGAQGMTGWVVRSPRRVAEDEDLRRRNPQLQGDREPGPAPAGTAVFPRGFVLRPGESCRIFNAVPRPGSCGDARFEPGLFPDTWPDTEGIAVLSDDALALIADTTHYSADPAAQPPPPNLRLVPLAGR